MTHHRVKLVVGLGNPGERYAETRHNAGFKVVERLLTELKPSFRQFEGFESLYWTAHLGGHQLFIQKPMTYMNRSGEAVKGLMSKNSIDASELMVVYDDLDLPLGRLRMRKKGSSGGHLGVESIIVETGSSSFSRLRIGIGRGQSSCQKDHVLDCFNESDSETFEKVLEMAVKALTIALRRDVDVAMNVCNGHVIAEATENSERDENEKKQEQPT